MDYGKLSPVLFDMLNYEYPETGNVILADAFRSLAMRNENGRLCSLQWLEDSFTRVRDLSDNR